MSLSRFVIAGLFFSSFAAVVGCSSSDAEGKDPQAITSAESELKLSGTKYLGKITNGSTKSYAYHAPSNYKSYGFDAKGGDTINLDVKSADGDAMAWLTDSSYNVLAANDDASADTFDSHIHYKVPNGQSARSYRIVFREYQLSDASFDVKLSVQSAAPASCTYGGQSYDPGDSFEATDGCNTCSCTSTGSVACTKKACVCDPASETNRSYIGTPDQCMVIRYTCQVGQHPFSNNCGCGCETIQ